MSDTPPIKTEDEASEEDYHSAPPDPSPALRRKKKTTTKPRTTRRAPPTPPPKPKQKMTSTVGFLKEFDPSTDDIEDWELTYNSFLAANELNRKHHDKRCHGIFLSSIGIQNCSLLKNLLAPTVLESATLETMFDKLKLHFKPTQKALAERYKFMGRRQQQGETAAQFLAALRTLARQCKFENNLNERLRDQLIFGLHNERAQRTLLAMDDDIKLDAVMAHIQAIETADRSTAIIRGVPPPPEEVHKASKVRTQPQKQQPHNQSSSTSQPPSQKYKSDRNNKQNTPGKGNAKPNNNNHKPSNQNSYKCIRCGSTNHKSFECPHHDKVCRQCNKKGHLQSMCISSGNYAPTSTHVKTVTVKKTGRHPVNKTTDFYYVDVIIDGKSHRMEFDTACDTSLLSKDFWSKELGRPPLQKSLHRFRAYNGTAIDPVGDLPTHIEYKGQRVQVNIPVVDGSSLFGKDMIKLFGAQFDWKHIAQQTKHVKQITNVHSDINNVLTEYADIFTTPTANDRIKGFKAKVILKDDAEPRFLKARPLPFAIRAKVDAELESMEKTGVIEKIDTSDWASPLVVVPKANGKVRITGDFKSTVNNQLHITQYPLANPDDIFANMANNKIFSTLDGSNAYHQMELEESSKNFLVINTHRGLYRYNVLPQGIASSPAIFQEFMDKMLRGIDNASPYVDDTITGDTEYIHHPHTLRKIFAKMRDYNFKMNKEKCDFGKPKVKFLGHQLSFQGLSTTQDKLEAIHKMACPHDVPSLRSFLGLVNFYGKFVKEMGDIAAPLYRLTRDNVPWKWTRDCHKAYEEVKRRVSTAPTLAHYDPSLPLGLACDASPIGLGVILFHTYPDGTERPIGYASKVLSPTEQRYSQIEKEGLAIIHGLKKFYKYLCGRRFTLVTDHKPLLTIFGPKHKLPVYVASRLHHWAVQLQQFQYDVIYRKSSDHGNADALSRLPTGLGHGTTNEFENTIKQVSDEICDTLPVTSKQVRYYTARDSTLTRVRQFMKDGWPKQLSSEDKSLQPYFTRRDELCEVHGIILWGIRVVIPSSLQKKILEELHLCHTGIVKMKSLARTHVWWPNLDHDIEETCRGCIPCQAKQADPPSSPLHPWQFPERPWQRLHMDLAGPFLNKMWMILVDAHSKWPEVCQVQGTTTATITSKLDDIIARFGIPEQIVTDNGKQFISKEFEHYCKVHNMKHVLSSVYHARSNGEAERFVRTFKEAMKQTEIPVSRRLPQFLFKYRSTPHATTGVTPAEMLLGRQIRTKLDMVRPDVNATVSAAQTRQQASYNKTAKERHLQAGDTVWVKTFSKHEEKWSLGTITSQIGPVTFMVDVGEKRMKRHADQIRLLRSRLYNNDTTSSSTLGDASESIRLETLDAD